MEVNQRREQSGLTPRQEIEVVSVEPSVLGEDGTGWYVSLRSRFGVEFDPKIHRCRVQLARESLPGRVMIDRVIYEDVARQKVWVFLVEPAMRIDTDVTPVHDWNVNQSYIFFDGRQFYNPEHKEDQKRAQDLLRMVPPSPYAEYMSEPAQNDRFRDRAMTAEAFILRHEDELWSWDGSMADGRRLTNYARVHSLDIPGRYRHVRVSELRRDWDLVLECRDSLDPRGLMLHVLSTKWGPPVGEEKWRIDDARDEALKRVQRRARDAALVRQQDLEKAEINREAFLRPEKGVVTEWDAETGEELTTLNAIMGKTIRDHFAGRLPKAKELAAEFKDKFETVDYNARPLTAEEDAAIRAAEAKGIKPDLASILLIPEKQRMSPEQQAEHDRRDDASKWFVDELQNLKNRYAEIKRVRAMGPVGGDTGRTVKFEWNARVAPPVPLVSEKNVVEELTKKPCSVDTIEINGCPGSGESVMLVCQQCNWTYDLGHGETVAAAYMKASEHATKDIPF